MNHKLPGDAFSFYMSQGPDRSYQSVADKYGVSKRTVTNTAVRERWKERAADIEAKARARTDEKILESREEMNMRHLKMWRFVQTKALETLKNASMETGPDAVRALESGIKGERLIRGEPTERTESVEAIIRGEYERWLVPVNEAEDEADDSGKETRDGEEPGRAEPAA